MTVPATAWLLGTATAVLLAGCSADGGGAGGPDAATTTAGSSSTATSSTATSAAGTDSAPPANGTATPGATGPAGAVTGPPAPPQQPVLAASAARQSAGTPATPGPTRRPVVSPAPDRPDGTGNATGPATPCRSGELSSSLGTARVDGPTRQTVLVLTHPRGAPCTLQGWPGLLLMDPATGEPLPGHLTRLGSTSPLVRLDAGGSATVTVGTRAGSCPADRVAVSLPGSEETLGVRGLLPACPDAEGIPVTVTAVGP